MYLHLKNTKKTQQYLKDLGIMGDIIRLQDYGNMTAIEVKEVMGYVDMTLNKLVISDLHIKNCIEIPLSEISTIYNLR